MKYVCKELNKDFSSQREMFLALKANKQSLIELKKATIKNADPVRSFTPTSRTEAAKSAEKTDVGYGDYVYPVINTINFLDSHKDLHVWGIWDKSAAEQTGKVYYIVNHDLALGSVISYPKEVEVMVKEMFWSELGRDYAGKTQALIFKAKLTEKSNRDAYLAIKDGEDLQNSVRMLYVSLDLAVNSGSEDFKEEKRIWDKYYPSIVNKEASEDGYFWAVTEAKIYKEGSAVLFGSNEATPIQYTEPKQNIGPGQSTQSGAAKSTLKRSALNELLKTLKA